MEIKKNLELYLKGEINSVTAMNSMIESEYEPDCANSFSDELIKEIATLRSLVGILLLEIKYPTVALKIEEDKIRKQLKNM